MTIIIVVLVLVKFGLNNYVPGYETKQINCFPFINRTKVFISLNNKVLQYYYSYYTMYDTEVSIDQNNLKYFQMHTLFTFENESRSHKTSHRLYDIIGFSPCHLGSLHYIYYVNDGLQGYWAGAKELSDVPQFCWVIWG